MSSVYISIAEFCIESGKSFMWIEKNNGPWKINTPSTVEPRFNEVAGDRPNLVVKSRVRYAKTSI